MIYCVVPPELADELYDQLVAHYAGDPEVEVIVDRRASERRGRESSPVQREQRIRRDRRRQRVPGELPALARGE